MDSIAPRDASAPEPDPLAVCVYCASSPALGKALAASGRPLVYGGGDRGLMGIVSNTVIQNGGYVTGVLPRAMVVAGGEGRGPVERAKAAGLPPSQKQQVPAVNEGNHKSILVESMHERKTVMARIAGGGFIGLPGGFGTFEEVLEAVTWSQLGIHQKPVVLLNINGFWEPLRALIDGAIKEAFIQEKNRSLVTFVQAPSEASSSDFDWGKAAVEALDSWKPPSDTGLFVWDQKTKWSST